MKLLLQTFAIMGKSINRFELLGADVVLRPALVGVSSADFTSRVRAIRSGREMATAMLPEIKAKLAALAR
jgi:NTE family protein